MSYNDSPGEQSEDGELRQSPIHVKSRNDIMDFSLSEDDVDTVDGLDIKPPQAHVGQSSHSKRRDVYDRHKHSDALRDDRKARKNKRHRERKERDLQHYQREREKERYYKERSSYDQTMYNAEMQYISEKVYREQRKEADSSSRRHAERKYEEKKCKEAREARSYRRDKYEEERRSAAGDKTLQDLRARLLSKRTNKNEEEFYRSEKDAARKQYRDTESMEKLLQGEAGMYVRDIINISSLEDGGRRHRHRDEDKFTDEERAEQDLRRERLLEAEREMARQKEQREKRHIEKQKRRIEIDATGEKRAKIEEHIILSDNTDVSDVELDTEYHQNPRNVEEEEEENHASRGGTGSEVESSVGSRSETSERDSIRSRTRTRSPSPSRSRSHSPSTPSEVSRHENSLDNGRFLHEEKNHENPTEEQQHQETENENTAADMEEGVKKFDDNLPPYFPAIQGCRSVEEFQCLNKIDEGTYGVVYRARDKRTEDIVALKRLKMEKEKEGFPITSLREINTLLKGQHPNIVTVREIVVGSNMDKIFIVMDYVEHDLKSLMETMRHKKQTFMPGEVKCLLMQLLKAVAHLHDNWILHRDLKTSNLLLSHKGILKVGDFGLAREYGSPLKEYTPIVVTLWYRAPELLLCTKEYSTPIDLWSVGCIYAELVLMNPLFPGKGEVDQLNRIFKELGTPNEKIWPGYNKLPAVMKMKFTDYPVSNLRCKFSTLSETGLALLGKFLTYDPVQRITAEEAIKHSYFSEVPLPIDPAMFPTWPAKSELGHRKALAASPKPPSGGREFKQLAGDGDDDGYRFRISIAATDSRRVTMGGGFSLKF